jgi:hypothetical protein
MSQNANCTIECEGTKNTICFCPQRMHPAGRKICVPSEETSTKRHKLRRGPWMQVVLLITACKRSHCYFLVKFFLLSLTLSLSCCEEVVYIRNNFILEARRCLLGNLWVILFPQQNTSLPVSVTDSVVA